MSIKLWKAFQNMNSKGIVMESQKAYEEKVIMGKKMEMKIKKIRNINIVLKN